MKCKFTIGQKVVFVPNLGGKEQIWTKYRYWPEANGIYTIKEMVLAHYRDKSGPLDVGLILEEMEPPLSLDGRSIAFFDWREFQPLSFLDIDISCFTQILTQTPMVNA